MNIYCVFVRQIKYNSTKFTVHIVNKEITVLVYYLLFLEVLSQSVLVTINRTSVCGVLACPITLFCLEVMGP